MGQYSGFGLSVVGFGVSDSGVEGLGFDVCWMRAEGLGLNCQISSHPKGTQS